ncbi:MAG: methylated-DNA--[protein]-cysteine S-methyltransferase [Acidimicrobiales bacterium]
MRQVQARNGPDVGGPGKHGKVTGTDPERWDECAGKWRVIASPVGEILIRGDDQAVNVIELPGSFDLDSLDESDAGSPAAVTEAASQLEAYFAHRLTSFSLGLDPGGTEFQRRVWFALGEIPYGETESYGSLAARIGRPGASRAVGAANGRNPLPIVLPCHRVIGSDGSLTGYGGGLELKQRLLDHERVLVPRA